MSGLVKGNSDSNHYITLQPTGTKQSDGLLIEKNSCLSLRGFLRNFAMLLAGNDFKAVEHNLQLHPLKFRDALEEKGFHLLCFSHDKVRFTFISWGLLGLFLFLWISASVLTEASVFPKPDLPSKIVFHLMNLMLCTVFVLPVVVSKVNLNPDSADIVCTYIGPLMFILPNLWILINGLLMTNMGILTTLDVQRTKLWTMIYEIGLPLLEFTFTFLILQSRVRRILYPRIAYVALYAGISSITCVNYWMNESKSILIIQGLGKFYFLTSLLEIGALLIILCVCFFARWGNEVRERVEYWKLSTSRAQLLQLKDISNTTKRKTGETAVEDLLNIIIKAQNLIQESETILKSELLTEAIDDMRKVQNMLTNSDSLYKVKFQPAGGGALEDDAMEAQYIEIFTDNRGTAGGGGNSNSTANNYGVDVISVSPTPAADADFRRSCGHEWSLDLLQAAKIYPNILLEVGSLLLEPFSNEFNVSPILLRNFIFKVQGTYRDNPYHNGTHAAMVAHGLSCLLAMTQVTQSPLFTRLDNAIAMLSALGHDAGHPGRSNQFFVNTYRTLAMLYNDKFVLENFHTAYIFKVMQSDNCAVFRNLDRETMVACRRKVVDLILSTDMSQHFEFVSKLRLRRQAESFNYLVDPDDLWLMVKACIKVADLGHSLVSWAQHEAWSLMVCEEFYQQGEEEALLGYPKSPLCDRSAHGDFCKNQKGFLEFVVQPLVTVLDDVDQTGKVAELFVHNLMYNKFRWENLGKDNDVPQISEELKQKKTDSGSISNVIRRIVTPKGFKLEIDSKVGSAFSDSSFAYGDADWTVEPPEIKITQHQTQDGVDTQGDDATESADVFHDEENYAEPQEEYYDEEKDGEYYYDENEAEQPEYYEEEKDGEYYYDESEAEQPEYYEEGKEGENYEEGNDVEQQEFYDEDDGRENYEEGNDVEQQEYYDEGDVDVYYDQENAAEKEEYYDEGDGDVYYDQDNEAEKQEYYNEGDCEYYEEDDRLLQEKDET